MLLRSARRLPPQLQTPLKSVRNIVRYLFHIGFNRYCPVCTMLSRRFGPAGLQSRKDALCFACGALERHRFIWIYFQKMTNLFTYPTKSMLHIAPEPAFAKRLKAALGSKYVTADRYACNVMVTLDIVHLPHPDESFDIIYCSHVLEHVADDMAALREFYRLLKPEGWAIIAVPVIAERTFEDPTITDPSERLRLFGQSDHVRCYGPDFIHRLHAARLNATLLHPTDFFNEDQIIRMGISHDVGGIYYCTKQ